MPKGRIRFITVTGLLEPKFNTLGFKEAKESKAARKYSLPLVMCAVNYSITGVQMCYHKMGNVVQVRLRCIFEAIIYPLESEDSMLQVPDNEYSLHVFEEEVDMPLIIYCRIR